MRILSTSAIALMAAAGFTGSALAADVLDRQYEDKYADQPAGVHVNWSGIYLGGRVGVGNANHNLSLESYDDDPEGDSHDGLGGNPDLETFEWLGLNGINSLGLIGGGQIGADKQMGNFVVGLFGTYDFSNMETEFTAFNNTEVIASKEYEWSAGARIGYLVNPETLLYGLVAYTETEYDLGEDHSHKFDGITPGVGIEFAATRNIFLGLEATHTFYGEETLFDEATSKERIRLTDDLDETKIMGTLKIKLNGGLY